MSSFSEERLRLVEHLRRAGISAARVLDAMGQIPRERFVPEVSQRWAYADEALGIGSGQTISQPYMVAFMTEQLGLTGNETVLEIGTGSGYQAAILARLASRVVTIERVSELAHPAETLLRELGIDNVEFHVGDGTLGWPAGAPYQGIIVTAAAPRVPEPLYDQLAEGGRLVIPVGDRFSQDLLVVTKTRDGRYEQSVCHCRFVPLIGQNGWKSEGIGE